MTAPIFQPLYRQVKQALLQSLQSMTWKPGQPIPSEMELAAQFGVSHGTVRKAVDELATENVLVRRQGKGTFVATHADQRVSHRFLRLVSDFDGEQETSRQILLCERKKPSVEIAQALQLASGVKAIHIARTLAFAEKTVILEHIWLSPEPFSGLSLKRLRDNHQVPLYALFEREFGVNMVRAQERLKAVLAETVQAEALDLLLGSPLLQVERTAYTYHDQPMELRLAWYDTNKHHYFNALQ